jgi:DNA-binding MarR family transcriptional regulator
VVRKPDPADGRRATLKLTKKGEKILEKLTATHRAQLRQIAPTLRTILRQLDR